MGVCEKISVCVSAARLEESESLICWLVYHTKARDATQDAVGANFAVRAPLSIPGGGEGGMGREVARGHGTGRGRRNERSSLMKNGGTLDDFNSLSCLRQPTAASQLNFNQ